MTSLFLYSTAYHLRQRDLLPGESLALRIGHKTDGMATRCAALIRVWVACLRHRHEPIYLPRAGSKDIWLIYRVFRRRVVLTSDGISDCLARILVLDFAGLRLGFAAPVDERFHVTRLRHMDRNLKYSADAPIGVFTKRGRDYDYVSPYVAALHPDVTAVVNPLEGSASRIYAPASTLLFEFASFPRECIVVVSCRASRVPLPKSRRDLLLAYEHFLAGLGFVIEASAP